VQGVGFRYSTQAYATRAGLGGWVRNLADGRVEAVFEGPRPAVERLVGWCCSGPRGATVREVETTWEEPAGLAGFSIR
jgi:acylphosphatase